MRLSLDNKQEIEILNNDEEIEALFSNNLRKKDINKIKQTALFIARKGCPKDTFNMANNAIYAINTKNGFSIVWDEKFAYYLPYVDKGINPIVTNSIKVQSNKGFVDRSIAMVWSYFYFNPRILSTTTNYYKKIEREKITKEFNNIEELYENEIKSTKEAPLFVKMFNDLLKGKSEQEVFEGNRRLLTNFYKSVKKSQYSMVRPSDKILNENDLIFDISKEKVFEE